MSHHYDLPGNVIKYKWDV